MKLYSKNSLLKEVWINDKITTEFNLNEYNNIIENLNYKKCDLSNFFSSSLFNDIVIFDIEVTNHFLLVGFLTKEKVHIIYLNEENYYVNYDCFYKILEEFLNCKLLLVGFNNLNYDNEIVYKLLSLKEDVFKTDCIDWDTFIKRLIKVSNSIVKKDFIESFNTDNNEFLDSKLLKKKLNLFTLDLFRIIGQKVSLKMCALRMGFLNLGNLDLYSNNLKELIEYNIGDLFYTLSLFYCLSYEINIKVKLLERGGLDLKLLNSSSSYIGFNVLKKLTNIKRGSLNFYPKNDLAYILNGYSLKGYLNFFEFYNYNNSNLKGFIHQIINYKYKVKLIGGTWKTVFLDNNEVRNSLDLGNLTLHVGVGGLNSTSDEKVYFLDESEFILLDISSYYPSIIKFLSSYDWKNDKMKSLKECYLNLLEQRLNSKDKFESEYLKLILNSFYGILRNKFYSIVNPELATLITIFGQLCLLTYIDFILQRKCELIFVDTDGLLFYCKKDLQEELLKDSTNFFNFFNMNFKHSFYKKIIYKNSKNYFLYESESNFVSNGEYTYNSGYLNSFTLKRNYLYKNSWNNLLNYMENKDLTYSLNKFDYMEFKKGQSINPYLPFNKDKEIMLNKEIAYYHSINGGILKTKSLNIVKDCESISFPWDTNEIDLDFYKNYDIKLFLKHIEPQKSFTFKTISNTKRDNILNCWSLFKNIKNKDKDKLLQHLVPGSLEKKYLKGVKLNSLQTYQFNSLNLSKLGLLTGIISGYICIDLDFFNIINPAFKNIIDSYIGKTLTSIKTDYNQILNEDFIKQHRYKIFFKFNIDKNRIDNETNYLSVHNNLNKFGFEVLWTSKAPFIFGYHENNKFYQVYQNNFKIINLPKEITNYLFDNEIFKVRTFDIDRNHRNPSVQHKVGKKKELVIEKELRNLEIKWISKIEEENSISWVGFCPFRKLHTTPSNNKEFSIKHNGMKLFVGCFHQSCNQEIKKLYKTLDYKINYNDNNDEIKKLIAKLPENESKLEIVDTAVGSGKTYRASLHCWEYIKKNEPFIVFTPSSEASNVFFNYIILHQKNDSEEFKHIDLNETVSLIKRGYKLKKDDKFLIAYHTYLGYKGASIEYFAFFKDIIKKGLEGYKFHIIIDEAHLLLNSTLLLTYSLTSGYHNHKHFDNVIYLLKENLSPKDFLENYNKNSLMKTRYNVRFDTMNYIYKAIPQTTIEQRKDNQFEVINSLDNVDDFTSYKIDVPELNATYSFLKSNLDLKKYKKYIENVLISNNNNYSLEEIIFEQLKTGISKTIIENKPTVNDKVLEFNELNPDLLKSDKIIKSWNTPWTKTLIFLNILPIIILKMLSRTISCISATFTSSEKELFKHIWDKNNITTKDNLNVKKKAEIEEIRFIGINKNVPLKNLIKVNDRFDESILKFYSTKRRAKLEWNNITNEVGKNNPMYQKNLAAYIESTVYSAHADSKFQANKTFISYLKSAISTATNFPEYSTTIVDTKGILPGTLIPILNSLKPIKKNDLYRLILDHHKEHIVNSINQAIGRILRNGGSPIKLIILENVYDEETLKDLIDNFNIPKAKDNVKINYQFINIETKEKSAYVVEKMWSDFLNHWFGTLKEGFKEFFFKKEYLKEAKVIEEENKLQSKADRIIEKVTFLFYQKESRRDIKRQTKINDKQNEDVYEYVINNLPAEISDFLTSTKRTKKNKIK